MEKKGETKDEANIDIREAVRMELSILDCPVCYNALRAPIFQCGVGHVLCSNCNVLLNECPQCSGTIFQRCFIMERVVESIVAPCSFSRYGCVEEITRFNKNKHENVCSYRPCFCPHSGCSFAGITASLLVHFTTHHKWPSMKFEYYKPFLLPVRPGPCLLHAQDEHLFLMNMEPLEPLGHAISLVCIQPDGRESMYGCSVNFSCFIGHNQTSTLESIKTSSLLDGLPMDYFCIVPYGSDSSSSVMLSTIIDNELVYDEVDDELEDEDDEAGSSDDN